MQKASIFFIFCVLLCEVSPKAPIRKEDLLNKKAALSKQLSPSVPNWDEIAFKLHAKDKPSQNKPKTMMNLMQVVSAKDIEISDIDEIKTANVKTNAILQNNTKLEDITKNNRVKDKQSKSKSNSFNSNSTVSKTPKKHLANETIGARLALFLQQNAANTTKEKPNIPEIIAPTMIPIFKPMPSSTRNTIPQPLANELIRKDNFVPQELNTEQLKKFDDIELNPNVFNPMQNKAILTPLLATEPKETLPDDVNQNVANSRGLSGMNNGPIENQEDKQQYLNPNALGLLQNGFNPQIRTEAVHPTNNHPSDITLKHEGRNTNHPNDVPLEPQKYYFEKGFAYPMQNSPANVISMKEAQNIDTTSAQNINGDGVAMNKPTYNEQSVYLPMQNQPQYELKISPPLPNNVNSNLHAQGIIRDIAKSDLNQQFTQEQLTQFGSIPQFTQERLTNFEKHQFNQNQMGTAVNQNDFIKQENVKQNSQNIVNQQGFGANQNDFIVRQNFGSNNNLGIVKNPSNEVNPKPLNNHNNIAIIQNDVSSIKNGRNQIPVHPGINSNTDCQHQAVSEQAKMNPMSISSGFQLPYFKASDVLEDFRTAPICQTNKPIVNSVTEVSQTKSQCEKPISLDGNIEDEDVAIVFKPKNISLLKFYGDLLKKITLTVLVPYHISKLTSS